MKVLFDEGVPRQLASAIADHDIVTVKSKGWLGVKNGRLLDLIEETGFEAFLTNDKRMESQQRLQFRTFAGLVLSTNHWETLKPHVSAISRSIANCLPGSVIRLNCGIFVPRRFRNLQGPKRP